MGLKTLKLAEMGTGMDYHGAWPEAGTGWRIASARHQLDDAQALWCYKVP